MRCQAQDDLAPIPLPFHRCGGEKKRGYGRILDLKIGGRGINSLSPGCAPKSQQELRMTQYPVAAYAASLPPEQRNRFALACRWLPYETLMRGTFDLRRGRRGATR